ncbi:hypothetical protein F5144DRAFT_545498 [Chaetomium tenue]|uniref:Uncharacterized protein n=1 Tax=Chaetomium tenue TaxID=1854479 RepID=A0ACB7PI27_9PEZI|nr:hypothetical protein F5144DRAFT_545498 [Chaetomium globosum]
MPNANMPIEDPSWPTQQLPSKGGGNDWTPAAENTHDSRGGDLALAQLSMQHVATSISHATSESWSADERCWRRHEYFSVWPGQIGGASDRQHQSAGLECDGGHVCCKTQLLTRSCQTFEFETSQHNPQSTSPPTIPWANSGQTATILLSTEDPEHPFFPSAISTSMLRSAASKPPLSEVKIERFAKRRAKMTTACPQHDQICH